MINSGYIISNQIFNIGPNPHIDSATFNMWCRSRKPLHFTLSNDGELHDCIAAVYSEEEDVGYVFNFLHGLASIVEIAGVVTVVTP